MRAPDPRIAESLWHRDWFSAALSLAIAFLIAHAFDRFLRGRFVRATVQRAGVSREADTRLRFVRRMIYATIVLIGIAVALSYFASVGRLATSLLASGAIAAAVIGFAAQRVLANFVAGIMLAVTQPIRVGDWITVEGSYGVVDDVRLNFTVLRTPSDARIVIPNEKLASSVLRNDTLVVDHVAPDVSIWIPPGADAERAIAALEEETGQAVGVAEAVPWGTRLSVGSDPVPPPQKPALEAELRRTCLRRLRKEGLIDG
jgi:small-conductance mechanosensitive channel